MYNKSVQKLTGDNDNLKAIKIIKPCSRLSTVHG